MLITLLGTLAAFLAFLLTLIFGRGQKRLKPVEVQSPVAATSTLTSATTSKGSNNNSPNNRKNLTTLLIAKHLKLLKGKQIAHLADNTTNYIKLLTRLYLSI